MSGVTAATVATYATIAAAAATTYEAVKSSSQGKAPGLDPSGAVNALKGSASDTSKRTSALLATQGGSAGEDLEAGATGGRQTVLGN